jgi:hypothetical protein
MFAPCLAPEPTSSSFPKAIRQWARPAPRRRSARQEIAIYRRRPQEGVDVEWARVYLRKSPRLKRSSTRPRRIPNAGFSTPEEIVARLSASHRKVLSLVDLGENQSALSALKHAMENAEYLRRRIVTYRRYLNKGLDGSLERFYGELLAAAQAALDEIERDERQHEPQVSEARDEFSR